MIPDVCPLLAHVESLTVIHTGKRFHASFLTGDPALLASDPAGKILYVIRGTAREIEAQAAARQFGKKRIYQAARLFEQWDSGTADEFQTIPIEAAKFRPVGTAGRIIYHSTKWGKDGYYYHDFTPETSVTISGGGNGKTIAKQIEAAAIIKIQPVRITNRGIE